DLERGEVLADRGDRHGQRAPERRRGRDRGRRRGSGRAAGGARPHLLEVLPRRRRAGPRHGPRAVHRARPRPGDGRTHLGGLGRPRRRPFRLRTSGVAPIMPGVSATRVLVIDDEAPIRLLCRVNLEAEGLEVLEAADGPGGLEKARAERPDVILLDVMMPGLDGWRVAEELLDDDRTSGIPIVFLTARAELRDRARGLDLGGVDYVTKLFNPVELAPLVRGLLERVEAGER